MNFGCTHVASEAHSYSIGGLDALLPISADRGGEKSGKRAGPLPKQAPRRGPPARICVDCGHVAFGAQMYTAIAACSIEQMAREPGGKTPDSRGSEIRIATSSPEKAHLNAS